MNSKDIVCELMDEWEAAKDEIKRLREENKRLLDRCISLVEGVERLRELLKIQEELSDESK